MYRTLDRLPVYLRAYCTEHDTSKYTARDHAAWRYIMRRAMDFFKDHAVSTYSDGFTKTGLSIDHIPHIDEIDRALQNFGWGAVPVVGFIPTWAFIEFQAHKILPIATDMRSVDHIAYTPAPDIVHEAAGHAPIIPDKDYSDYLAYYASLGTKAIYSKQDLMLYEAVRYLSDIKEKPESTAATIAGAEIRLKSAVKAFNYTSEQALVARMSWWTAEYGLAGSLEQPKIYGAGLLSSVGESKLAMTDRVKKIRLSLDCIRYSYNITEPQPQLFVAENMHHLTDVLHELDATLAYRHGGINSLQKCLEAQAVSTICLDTRIAASGCLQDFEAQGDRIDFIKFKGPVQLSLDGKEISGQGISRHAQGFSSPIGRLASHSDRPLSRMTASEHQNMGLAAGKAAELKFISGFHVRGTIKAMLYTEGKLCLITWVDCTVTRAGRCYFEAAWGEFDMLVGEDIPSTYGGPADRELFGEHEISPAETTPARESPYSNFELESFQCFAQLRDLRSQFCDPKISLAQRAKAVTALEQLSLNSLKQRPDEWLLLLEIFELGREQLSKTEASATWLQNLGEVLHSRAKVPGDQQELIQEGLLLIR